MRGQTAARRHLNAAQAEQISNTHRADNGQPERVQRGGEERQREKDREREGWIMGEMAEKGLRVEERKEKGEGAKRTQGERQAARGRAGEEEKG